MRSKRKSVVLAAVAILTVHSLPAATRFSASDVKKAHLPTGQISIRNNAASITTYRYLGDISKALFSLKSSRSLTTHSYGAQIYNSSSKVTSL